MTFAPPLASPVPWYRRRDMSYTASHHACVVAVETCPSDVLCDYLELHVDNIDSRQGRRDCKSEHVAQHMLV